MALPKFLQPYLPSYDLRKLDIKRDKILIITSVLNQGDYRALRWLTKTYSKREIEDIVKTPVRGMWYEWILKYWLRIFGIKIPLKTYQTALIKL
ncbi:MAG: DUF6922 domain-containing protein [Microgenomates group bacterium]